MAETWIPIAREFGVPAAFAVCFMVALGFIGWQCIKGFKWCGNRLIGESGILTTVGLRHVSFMDAVEQNDVKHAESLHAIAGCMDRLTAAEDVRHREKSAKLDAIHQDVKDIKGAVC